MKRATILSILIFIVILTAISSAQVYEAWVARYNGPANLEERGNAIILDDSAYVYVVGSSASDGANSSFLLIKYNCSGEIVWARTLTGIPNTHNTWLALAVDSFSNVCVTGKGEDGILGLDFVTAKYSSSGDSLWVKRFDISYFESPKDIDVDAGGNVYVTGANWYEDNSYVTIKYSPLGDTIWSREINGGIGSNQSKVPAIDVDDSGNAFIVGTVIGGILVYKYSASGDSIWADVCTDFNSSGIGRAVALDDSGNILVLGTAMNLETGSDIVLIKYNPYGDNMWIRNLTRPGNSNDAATDVAMARDGSGSIYVVGYSMGPASYDYMTAKVDSLGDTSWVRFYDGPGNSYDFTTGVAVDDSANVYVTGMSFDTLGLYYDYATISYDNFGNLRWVKRYDGDGNTYDEAFGIAVDKIGHVYVTGRTDEGSTFFDCTTIKYSPCSTIPGDINTSGDITLGDIIHLLNYLFDRDNPPCIGIDPGNCWTFDPICRGDVNNSGSITLGDVIHLLNYVFDRDNPPCVGTDPGNCWVPEANGACCLAVP